MKTHEPTTKQQLEAWISEDRLTKLEHFAELSKETRRRMIEQGVTANERHLMELELDGIRKQHFRQRTCEHCGKSNALMSVERGLPTGSEEDRWYAVRVEGLEITTEYRADGHVKEGSQCVECALKWADDGIRNFLVHYLSCEEAAENAPYFECWDGTCVKRPDRGEQCQTL